MNERKKKKFRILRKCHKESNRANVYVVIASGTTLCVSSSTIETDHRTTDARIRT